MNDTDTGSTYVRARYFLRFQVFDANARRPHENEWREIEASNITLVPNVGDYVRYENLVTNEHPPNLIRGKVRSRLFEYGALSSGAEVLCTITIVVEPCGEQREWLELSND